MYRLNGMTLAGNTVVANVSYNVANQLLTMYYGYNETRAYNTLGQLTGLNVQGPYGTVESLTYNHPVGANNGKISSMYNAVSAETVTYTYDSLNRLATAAGSGWSQTYGYDPFGNLTSKTPGLSITVNQANNQIQGVYGVSYDANGNQNDGAYDAENRPINDGTQQYAYDAQNRRIWSWPDMGGRDTLGNATGYTVNMYSVSGQKLGAYVFQPTTWEHGGFYTPVIQVTLSSSDAYFGSWRLAVMDNLGSAAPAPGGLSATFYPWGEFRGSTSPQNTWSFATYWQDSSTGLDYANNRYYSSAYGRFMTDDPSSNNWDPANPQSWNTYAYVNGDPINSNDPSGLDVNIPTSGGGNPSSCLNTSFNSWLQQNGFNPISPGDNLGTFFNTPTGVLGLTMYYEQTTGSQTLFTDFAQTIINRYELQFANPTLDHQLGLPSGSFISVAEQTSQVWVNGNLRQSTIDDLGNVLDGSAGSRGCNQLILALTTSETAQSYITGSTMIPGATVSAQTYWFYEPAAASDPVQHQFWVTNTVTVPGYDWVFETLVRPVPRRPVRHRNR